MIKWTCSNIVYIYSIGIYLYTLFAAAEVRFLLLLLLLLLASESNRLRSDRIIKPNQYTLRKLVIALAAPYTIQSIKKAINGIAHYIGSFVIELTS